MSNQEQNDFELFKGRKNTFFSINAPELVRAGEYFKYLKCSSVR